MTPCPRSGVKAHLHPTGQRTLARLLRDGDNQKVIATHSSDIVSAFDPDFIAVVKPGGEIIQPKAGFLSDDERMFIRWWVRDKLEPLTARRVVAVEGLSDRIILERAAEVTERHLDRLGVSVLEARGSGEMGPVDKLFGPSGFNIPMSLLIDADAVDATAKKLGVEPDELSERSVWVSSADLEDEYVTALGAGVVFDAMANAGQVPYGALGLCKQSGPGGTRTVADVAAFIRGGRDENGEKRSGYKTQAALSVIPLITKDIASKITSIENLLNEIAK